MAAGLALAIVAVLQPIRSGARGEDVPRVILRTAPLTGPVRPRPAGAVLSAGVRREPERTWVRGAPVAGPAPDARHAPLQPHLSGLRTQDIPRTLVVRGRPVHGDLRPPRPVLQPQPGLHPLAVLTPLDITGQIVVRPAYRLKITAAYTPVIRPAYRLDIRGSGQ